MKKNMLLQSSFVYSLSFTKRLEGNYMFYEIGNDKLGDWSQKISFYGVLFNFILPLKNYL
jgi:hypothetical protein